MGRRSQEVQSARRQAAVTPEMLREMAMNPPLRDGSALGMIRYHDFTSGRVVSWVVERGNRANNYRLRAPGGKRSRPHGMAWILEKIRPYLIGRKTRPLS